MVDKVRLRATWSMEYDANPDHYVSSDPAEMAKQDEASADPVDLLDFEESVFKVEVVPVEGRD